MPARVTAFRKRLSLLSSVTLKCGSWLQALEVHWGFQARALKEGRRVCYRFCAREMRNRASDAFGREAENFP